MGVFGSLMPDAPPQEQPQGIPANVMAALAAKLIGSQPQRLPAAPQYDQATEQAAMMPETFANPMVKGAIEGMATLPRRAIENSQYSLDSGNYDPGPTLEAAMLPMGTGAIAGVPLKAGEEALGAGIRTYRSVPDSLMGYRKSGPQKGFEETNYPHTQDVAVTLPGRDGSAPETFVDAIKGMNANHAIERAHRNWPDAVHITPITGRDGAQAYGSLTPQK
jgi:hypothetical protein